VLETRRAEAAKLLALAQVEIESGPTEALAYTTASLELADTSEARLFAVKTLWKGPPLRALDLRRHTDQNFPLPTFSSDGRWLAVGGFTSYVLVFSQDGGDPLVLGGHLASTGNPIPCEWTRDNLIVTGRGREGRVHVWSVPGGQLLRTVEFGGSARWQVGESHLFAEIEVAGQDGQSPIIHLKRWKLPDGEAEDLGSVQWPNGATPSRFDPTGRACVYAARGSVYARRLPIAAQSPDRLIARHSSGSTRVEGWRRPEGLFSIDDEGQIVLWTTHEGVFGPGKILKAPGSAKDAQIYPHSNGRWIVDSNISYENRVQLWDLSGLESVEPWVLRRSRPFWFTVPDFHPSGEWVVATTRMSEVVFWPLNRHLPSVVNTDLLSDIPLLPMFTADGNHLVTWTWNSGRDWLRLWSVPGIREPTFTELSIPKPQMRFKECSKLGPRAQQVLCWGYGHETALLSLTGEEPFRLEGLTPSEQFRGAFSPSGRLVAMVSASKAKGKPATARVWDLETGEVRAFEVPDSRDLEGYITKNVEFADESTLFVAGEMGLMQWNFETGSFKKIVNEPCDLRMAANRQRMITYELTAYERSGPFLYHDLQTGDVRELDIPREVNAAALDITLSADGSHWITSEENGLLWVGLVDGGKPHILPGHSGPLYPVAISPDNRWVASSGLDKTLRLWPMPDLSKPPLHTLPHDELIAKLKTLTNLRAVRDPESSTGWKIEVGPFPGWATVPEW
jgi:WD40 repeat protein